METTKETELQERLIRWIKRENLYRPKKMNLMDAGFYRAIDRIENEVLNKYEV